MGSRIARDRSGSRWRWQVVGLGVIRTVSGSARNRLHRRWRQIPHRTSAGTNTRTDASIFRPPGGVDSPVCDEGYRPPSGLPITH